MLPEKRNIKKGIMYRLGLGIYKDVNSMTIIKIYVTIQRLPFSCVQDSCIFCVCCDYVCLIAPGTEKGAAGINGWGKYG